MPRHNDDPRCLGTTNCGPGDPTLPFALATSLDVPGGRPGIIGFSTGTPTTFVGDGAISGTWTGKAIGVEIYTGHRPHLLGEDVPTYDISIAQAKRRVVEGDVTLNVTTGQNFSLFIGNWQGETGRRYNAIRTTGQVSATDYGYAFGHSSIQNDDPDVTQAVLVDMQLYGPQGQEVGGGFYLRQWHTSDSRAAPSPFSGHLVGGFAAKKQ